ncbi:hypothetical protein Pcinc_040394 [Petrolisthes cinctipes]|uniref:PiggyBac transposable element-derived protein domain-containing protein n=1 Tax=Petrolisthes cinctipes TaxID=88211 RepID=A0AAE1EKU6_PETCI|nr:hypothetical protein Pcinc_040394 [Petrolisthes cinctipes]
MNTKKRPRPLKTDAEILRALEDPSDSEGEDEGLDDSLLSMEADGCLGGSISEDISQEIYISDDVSEDDDNADSEPIPSTSTAKPRVQQTLRDSLCTWNRVSNVGEQGHPELDSIPSFTGQHSISGFEDLTPNQCFMKFFPEKVFDHVATETNRSFMHFANNEEDKKDDRLFKIRKILNEVQDTYMAAYKSHKELTNKQTTQPVFSFGINWN